MESLETNLNFLTSDELNFYEKFKKSRRASLTEDVAEVLYPLFEQGKTCKEIWALNQNLLPGAIIEARLIYNWDKRKNDHEGSLESAIKSKALNTQANTLQFVADLLNITMISQKQAMAKYLETKDPEDLKDIIKIDDVKSLKTLVEIHTILATPLIAPANSNPGNTLVYNQQNIQVPGNTSVHLPPAIDVGAHASFLTTQAKLIAKEERDRAEASEISKKLKSKNAEES